MVFIFYMGNGPGGGGWRGAALSVGVSIALTVANRLETPAWLFENPLALLAGVAVIATGAAVLCGHRVGAALWRGILAAVAPPEPPVREAASLDAVLKRLRAMPTELYAPARDLSIHELRDRLKRRRLDARLDRCVERADLVKAYDDALSDGCPICAEPWAEGDVYRQLEGCGHCFHIECIDRWALTSADKGRVPACPLCKSEF